jgi:flagellar biosynthetic protein FliQ
VTIDPVLLYALRQGLYLALLVSAPVAVTVLVVGIVSSVLQTITQVQEPTLSFLPKMVAGCVALALSAAWVGSEMLRFTRALLEHMPRILP